MLEAEVIHKFSLNETAASRVVLLSRDSGTRGGVQVRTCSVSSVQKVVSLRSGVVSGVRPLCASRVRPAFVLSQYEYVSRQSPRAVIALAMEQLRRAAEARKGTRIAQRLASLAEGKVERVTWSSLKSLRGVC